MALEFEITARSRSTAGRTGVVRTPHGAFETPAFMPVGTRGSVKGLFPGQVRDIGAEIILGNTYHLLLRPGAERVRDLGGLQRFTGWNGPMLTDSGGYQAYSMSDINALDDDGVRFKSIIDGSTIHMTPESSMQVQNDLGADIIMAFDDCPPTCDPSEAPMNLTRRRLMEQRAGGTLPEIDYAARTREANERTVRWLERCKAAHARADEQALFGIVQGGLDLDQRAWSVDQICSIELPGYAIGGVAVGETADQIAGVVRHTAPLMPEDRPRYLMGVGYERDIVAACLAGIDMFDCVLPTRNGRNANAFTRTGPIRLKNARFAEDPGPLEDGCDCPACSPGRYPWAMWSADGEEVFSRAYIRHLFLAGEMLGPMLVSLHNLRHFQRLLVDIRQTMRDDDWLGFAGRWPVAAPGIPEAAALRSAEQPASDG